MILKLYLVSVVASLVIITINLIFDSKNVVEHYREYDKITGRIPAINYLSDTALILLYVITSFIVSFIPVINILNMFNNNPIMRARRLVVLQKEEDAKSKKDEVKKDGEN